MEVLQPGLQIRPEVTHEQVTKLIDALYSLKDVHIVEILAYDDKNYHIQMTERDKSRDKWQHGYVFKIMNSLDSKKLDFVEAQNGTMLFLGSQGIKCPQPVKNKHGNYYSVEKIYKEGIAGEYKEHVVRLLTYQPGKPLSHVPCTPRLFFQAGCYIAGLDILLKNFKHPAFKNHKSTWMLEYVPTLGKFLYAVKDPERQAIVEEVIQKFSEEVVPKMDSLEKGLLHGDFNENNILVEKCGDDWNICAVLDFGDCNFSCYLFELAITICYMMLQSKQLHPLEAGGHVIAGYITKRPLPALEFQLLKLCVCARLCQSLVLGAYSYLQDPGNQYILSTAANGWSLLQNLWHTSDEEVCKRWEAVMASYTNS
ncbi:hydroxylysine kinase [Anabrus simplex]|uniref:hydroxylysine kinase n=1 Tax=Anabrus simplex TaxID=316456 RepID=UPI0034DCF8B1